MAVFYPASVSEQDVRKILKNFYNIEAHAVSRLKGFDSVNYHVMVKCQTLSPNPSHIPENTLLKIGPCSDPSEMADFLQHQIRLMQKLSQTLPELIQRVFEPESGLLVPKVEVSCQNAPNDIHHHNVVLLEYLPGIPMIEVLPFSNALLKDVGRSFSKLSLALQNCTSDEGLRRTNHKWDPKNVLFCEDFLHFETDEDRKLKFTEFLELFRDETLPFIQLNCRKALIHADGSCNNIIVKSDFPDQVRGIIDFEDVCSSYLVFECGSLLMYTFAYMPEADFASIGAAVMQGFCEIQPLWDSEWEVLIEATLARHVQSLVYGVEAACLNPDNWEYLLETNEKGWESFKRLLNCDMQEMVRSWRSEDC